MSRFEVLRAGLSRPHCPSVNHYGCKITIKFLFTQEQAAFFCFFYQMAQKKRTDVRFFVLPMSALAYCYDMTT